MVKDRDYIIFLIQLKREAFITTIIEHYYDKYFYNSKNCLFLKHYGKI